MAERSIGGEGPVEPTRSKSPDLVNDPIEAEHMAHAMDPHYEQAKRIDEVNDHSYEIAQAELQRDLRSPLRADSTDKATREAQRDESLSWGERKVSVAEERTALEDAAEAARKAGDAAGGQASARYRHEQQKSSEQLGRDVTDQ